MRIFHIHIYFFNFFKILEIFSLKCLVRISKHLYKLFAFIIISNIKIIPLYFIHE